MSESDVADLVNNRFPGRGLCSHFLGRRGVLLDNSALIECIASVTARPSVAIASAVGRNVVVGRDERGGKRLVSTLLFAGF
jgi:hypothetical protein